MRLRWAVVAVAAVLVLLAGAFVGAIRYGAGAVQPGGGYLQTIRATGRPVWVGVDLRNTSGVPVLLHSFVPRGVENLRILDVRVVTTGRSGFSMLTASLPGELQRALDASAPIDGFVLPPHERAGAHQIVVQVQRIDPGRRAVMRNGAIVYSALGLDQGVINDGVSCIRAPGRSGCGR